MIEEAEKYQKERDSILDDNKILHNQVENIKAEYKEKEFDIEWKYKNKIRSFERENNILLDAEKQIKQENKERELEIEL